MGYKVEFIRTSTNPIFYKWGYDLIYCCNSILVRVRRIELTVTSIKSRVLSHLATPAYMVEPKGFEPSFLVTNQPLAANILTMLSSLSLCFQYKAPQMVGSLGFEPRFHRLRVWSNNHYTISLYWPRARESNPVGCHATLVFKTSS